MNRDESAVSNQVLDELKRYIEDLLSFFGLRAAVKISTSESSHLDINIADSEISRLLVGTNGRNLNALQHIISAFSKTKWPDLDLTINLDIGQYRARQTERLLKRVYNLAEEILKSNQPKELHDLNALERRIVHKYISDNYSGRLITESSGQGSERRLFIKTVN